MGKRTDQKKLPSGFKHYILKDKLVVPTKKFLYEVSIHKYWKNGYSFYGNKFFESDKLLEIKKPNKFKAYKDYLYEKEISLIGVPYRFIQENNLQLYKEK